MHTNFELASSAGPLPFWLLDLWIECFTWSTGQAYTLAVLWTLAPFLRCHGDLELDSVGVSTKIILVEWPWLGGPIREIKIPVQELWLKT